MAGSSVSVPAGHRRSRTRCIPAVSWLLLLSPVALLVGCRSTWYTHAMRKQILDHPGIIWDCPAQGLHWKLLKHLAEVADEYLAETDRPLVVTSGRRSLRQQALLMAQMTREQLEGMYCRDGYPDYVRDLVSIREEDGSRNVEATYRILCRRKEGYISSHLYGGAIDIAAEGADVACLKLLLEKHGFRILDERSLRVPCIHAACLDVPMRIIRK